MMIETTSCAVDCSRTSTRPSKVDPTTWQIRQNQSASTLELVKRPDSQPTTPIDGAGDSQQHLSTVRPPSLVTAPAAPTKRSNFHHQTSSAPPSSTPSSSRISYFQPQPGATLTIASPHYHQHRLLLAPQSPLLFPPANFGGHPLGQSHQYQSPVASALAAVAAGGGPTNGSFQSLSSLSPDARACFTATYLCVLIVNNTWLDCNLLEMLCNGTTTLKSSGSTSSDTGNGSGGGGGGGTGAGHGADEDDIHSRRNREQMEAFEMILNELVAFAGGGRNESGSIHSSDRTRLPPDRGNGANNVGRGAPRAGIYIAPVNLGSDAEPELPRQVVPPDEGGGSGSLVNGNASIVTLFYSDNQSVDPGAGEQTQDELKQLGLANGQSSLVQHPRVVVAKLNPLIDDDEQAAILKQYFDDRRSQLAAEKPPASNRPPTGDLLEPSSRSGSGAKLATGDDLATITTQAPNMNGGPITNWISRPLRDWGSYLFWSSSPSGDLANQSATPNSIRNSPDEADLQTTPTSRTNLEANKQTQNTVGVQLLRPIDRTENYNTIQTNQTSQKQQLVLEIPYNLSPIVTTNNHRALPSQIRQNNHQDQNERTGSMQLLASGTTRANSLMSSFAPDLADQMSVPLTTLGDLIGSSSSVTMAELSRQQSSTSTPTQHSLLRQQPPQQQQQQVSRPQEASFATSPVPLRPAYDSPPSQIPMQVFRESTMNQQQHFKTIQQQQQQQQRTNIFNRQQSGQNQYPRPGDECDCGPEFVANIDQPPSPSTSSLFSAVYSESCYRYCQSRLGSSSGSSSTPSLLDQQSSPATSFSTTSSTSLSTSGAPVVPSGGKMNPLDITFLLYTRRHRDMLDGAGEDLLQLQSSPGSASLATRNPLSSAINTNTGSGGGGGGGGISSGGSGQQYNGDEADRNSNNPNNSFNIGLGEILDINNEDTIGESSFNGSLPVKLIIHGFGSGGRRPWVTDMIYKLLDYENVNVIVVDWEKGATLPNYVQAAGNTRLVGHKIASLIRAINARHGLTANSYHLIGFSLGAHVAGFAGMEIRNSTSISHHWINRITGLDPASPLFEGYETDDRLDPSDAQFVDVIHSNGDGVLRGGFGSLQPMGHVDFYPNGGRVQVGCNSVLLSALSDIIYGKWQSLCNHRRALNFFMDSFQFDKCKFRSFNCDSYDSYLKGDCFDCGLNEEKCSYMGYLANYSKGRGKMYLTTHEEAPFCANQFLAKIIGTRGFKTHWGKVEVTLVGQDGKNESFWLSAASQQSNNHELPSGQKDLIQHSMQNLIVSHLALANLTHILLRYTKYRGWIYSGGESWSIDKVYIADSDGRVKSFCGYSTVLESHIMTRLNLDTGNCTVNEVSSVPSPAMNGQQISRAGGPTTSGSSTLITSGLQQQQQQQSQTHHQQQSQQQQQQLQQPQTNQPRTPRMFSPLIQSLGELQAFNGHSFQPRSLPANDWHQQLSQLGFGNFKNSPPSTIVT